MECKSAEAVSGSKASYSTSRQLLKSVTNANTARTRSAGGR